MYPDTIIGVLLISAAAIADVKVTQSPGNIEITEGQEFQISCTFTPFSIKLYAITWSKAVIGSQNCKVTNTSEEFIGRVLYKHDKVSKSSQLIVMDTKQNDFGIYYCEVQVMNAGNGSGKGTRVTVNGVNDSKKKVSAAKRKLTALSSSLVLIILLLLLITILIVLRRRKSQDRTSRTGNEEQVETPNTVVYANLRIDKSKRHRPGNHINDQIAGPPLRAYHRDENTVVYAAIRPPRGRPN
ncbi:natural cytotoxicity triggering receptor 3-like [Scyliorhinus canicula]|uniref:natural cytotoxicity triggering receptor 3-like n=1 Tax=Scyliorhinus canicula TaxID=7830 RepID=UPI0018F2A8D2|nr:natural cytotoxicity triggering receptor 3-like [Scyliorhinus canicula]